MEDKSIKKMSKKFKSDAVLEVEVLELKKENRALKETVSKLLSEIERLNNIDKSNVIKLELSPEEEILEVQIMRLQAISRERMLDINETKALDIHIKNKRLLENKSTMNADYKKVPQDVDDSELLKLAESVEESN